MSKTESSVLKGRYIIARGKRRRSVSPGWRNREEFVCGRIFISVESLIQTKWSVANFLSNNLRNSVREMSLTFYHVISRTVHFTQSVPRAPFRIVPTETVPWAIRYWPYRPFDDLSFNYKH